MSFDPSPVPRLSDRLRDTTLPNDLGAEQSVLGCAMMKQEALSGLLSELRVTDFYDPKHRLIFEAMIAMHEQGHPCDILTVANHLVVTGDIAKAGGREYIAALPSAVPFVDNYPAYIRAVRDASVRRKLIYDLDEVIGLCFASEHEAEHLIQTAANRLMNVREEGENSGLVHIGETLKAKVNEWHANAKGERERIARTGYPRLDDTLGGLRKGGLYILASRPGVGKSAFALNIAQNMAQFYDMVVAVFSLEMGRDEVVTRMMSSKTGLPFQEFDRLKLKDRASWDKVTAGFSALLDLPVYIDDHSAINVVEIHARCRQLQLQQHGLGLVVVDYLQLMGTASSRSKAENRQQQIAEISRMLKVMARELNVPVLALSQLSREVDRAARRPRLADLRESGAIEQDADVVMFLHDPARVEESADYGHAGAREIELIIEKNRQGERATIPLNWNPERLRFAEPGMLGQDDPDALPMPPPPEESDAP
ncbi:MAG: replicative DNA helicase [Saccharofermentanales bacterium]|jgi:replicative DNA helicase